MKSKFLTALTVGVLAASIMTCSACGSGELDLKGAALPHFSGAETSDGYDSSVFYKNELALFGGDSDVIWVPEERDPVNGGYFYQYTSGNFLSTRKQEGKDAGALSCLRSKDLNSWELCGAVNGGYSSLIAAEDWPQRDFWAPEVEYDPVTERYYLFVSARTWTPNAAGHTDIDFDRTNWHFLILSSEAPQGPFKYLTSDEYYTFKGETVKRNDSGEVVNRNGEVITNKRPQIDVANHFGLNYPWGVIDLSPFVDYDENGNRHIYLYFSKEWMNEEWAAIRGDNDYTYSVLSIWCMEMKDWLTPDYDTLRLVAYPSSKSVEYSGSSPIHDDNSYNIIPFDEDEEGFTENDNGLNEGAQVVAHRSADGKKRYYLTFSQTGYAARDYGCYQAVSDSPAGPFVKLGRSRAALGVNEYNDFMTGVGHHAYCEVAGELFNIYWVHGNPLDVERSGWNGRIYAFDRQTFIYDSELGYDIMYGNGPTYSLQPQPIVVSGLKNIAADATISVSSGDASTVKWLNDGKFTALEYYADNEFRSDEGTVITLTFGEPRSIRGIMVYNSMNYDRAFGKVDSILFTLAEKPSWYSSDNYNGYMYINSLAIPSDSYNSDNIMRPGGSACASFNEIKVSKIEIAISSSLSGGSAIAVSEIAVLGK